MAMKFLAQNIRLLVPIGGFKLKFFGRQGIFLKSKEH